ncbi:MAG: sulfate reduction electron transfer complex DsrMKJOP subunit DsrJ [Peptococcaceae bacterium]
MYNSRNIIIGLVIFVGIFTLPFMLGAGKTTDAPQPSLDTPQINSLTSKECIEDVEFMRSNHMQLLNDWKVSVVREGNRIYVSQKDGQEVNISLQNTCLDCHSNKEEFCDACHTYAEVEPNCWDCHVATEEVR